MFFSKYYLKWSHFKNIKSIRVAEVSLWFVIWGAPFLIYTGTQKVDKYKDFNEEYLINEGVVSLMCTYRQ